MDGWIKLWRKSIESQVWVNDGLWRLWCYCLMVANHKDNWVEIDGLNEPVLIKRGQFMTGRFSLYNKFYTRKKKSNKSPLTVWRWLQTLEKMGNLNIETNNRFSMITICNYETYQSSKIENEQPNEQPVNNSRTTVEQPVNTNKNVKKAKNANNEKEMVLFDIARKKFGGSKRGNLTEFLNFQKKHSDWKEVIPLLEPAVQKQIVWRAIANGEFRPPWMNFSTWINNRCWELELEPSKSTVKKDCCHTCQSTQVSATHKDRWYCSKCMKIARGY